MPKPQVYLRKETIGRRGTVSLDVEFVAEACDDLNDDIVLDRDYDTSGKYTLPRFAVEKVKGNWSAAGNGIVEFDGLPRGTICAISPESHDIDLDFSSDISGAKCDPTPESPANIVITTDGMVVGDRIYLELSYRESGKRESWA